MAISSELQAKVNEVVAEKERLSGRLANVETHNKQIEQELAQARQELNEAVEALADNPTQANRDAEKEARKKVASLEMEVAGSRQRTTAVFKTNNSTLHQLQIEALQMAKQELRGNYDTKKPEALKAIEDAKKAYIEALKGYYDLSVTDTQKAYYDIARQIGANDQDSKNYEPGTHIHKPIFTWRGPGYNYYGMFKDELDEVLDRGVIKKGAIRPE